MSQIKITQERSKIRCLKKHKRTLEALGLRRPNHSVIHNDTPQIRGMVAQVSYLVRVESAAGEAAGAKQVAAKPRSSLAKPKRGAAGRPKRAVAKAGRGATRKAATGRAKR
jgi:large subunit ribosomal protein L30